MAIKTSSSDMPKGNRPIVIGFVVTPAMLVTGTALPFEMWRAALDYCRARRANDAGYVLQFISVGDRRADAMINFEPCKNLTDAPDCDVIYLPALWRNPARIAAHIELLGSWLVQQHAGGALIAAVSTGVSLLAKSGLLDGRAATTHWDNFDRFEREYPAVQLKRQFFITQSGTLFCAASINSLADVTVHLIERFIGRNAARHVERNFSHEIRRTYEEYRYLDGAEDVPSADEAVVTARLWIDQNLSDRASVAEIAQRHGMSTRSFDRRFRAATGTSPRRYWQQQRLLTAKELLESTNLSISEIAHRVGYDDASYFAAIFRREISVTPREYRVTVRAKLFR